MYSICENDKSNINLSKEASLSDLSSSLTKKNNIEKSLKAVNFNSNNQNNSNNKNIVMKSNNYKNSSDILYNTNSNKYKYIQENKKIKKKIIKNPSPRKVRSASCLTQIISDKIGVGNDKIKSFYLNEAKKTNMINEEKPEDNIFSSSYNYNGFNKLKKNKKLHFDLGLKSERKQSNNISCDEGNNIRSNKVYKNSRNIQIQNNNNTIKKSKSIEGKFNNFSFLPKKITKININKEKEKTINKPNNNNNKTQGKKISFNIENKEEYKPKGIIKKDVGKEEKKILDQNQANKEKILSEFLKDQNLTSKQKTFYILSQSPALRLCERVIFSRSSQEIKKLLSHENILERHKELLDDKIDELKGKIRLCEKTLNTPFSASKTSEIALNFITSFHEEEFKGFPLNSVDKEEKSFYYNYLKLLYLLFGEDHRNIKDKELKNNLYDKIQTKGFANVREYLYTLYIKKKNCINAINNIEEVNKVTKEIPDILDNHITLKMCKFISFTEYLIKEIINYANLFISTSELKVRSQNFLDTVQEKLILYQQKNKELKK